MNRFLIYVSLFIFCLACNNSSCSDSTDTLSSLQENHKLVYGIDISHHQKEIDWSKVRTYEGHPIQFVYMKATEGTTIQDPKYAYNLEEARKNGFPVGAYHYFVTTTPPEEACRQRKTRSNINA